MTGYQEVEQAMQQMRLIKHHECPEAFVGKTISVFMKEAQALLCGSVLNFELTFSPREEPPPGQPRFPRDVQILVRTTLPKPITVSRVRYAGSQMAVTWKYDEIPVNFEEDVTIR